MILWSWRWNSGTSWVLGKHSNRVPALILHTIFNLTVFKQDHHKPAWVKIYPYTYIDTYLSGELRSLLSNCDVWSWQSQADGKERTMVSPSEGCLSWWTEPFMVDPLAHTRSFVWIPRELMCSLTRWEEAGAPCPARARKTITIP